MRKFTTIIATIATTVMLAACQPAPQEEAASPEATETTAATPEAAPAAEMPAADGAKSDETVAAPAGDAATTEPEGAEHTGGIKVGQ